MKTFYALVSRVLLVIFAANCLLPSAAWAQRAPRRGTTAQSAADRRAMLDSMQQDFSGGSMHRSRLLEESTAPIQRDGHVAQIRFQTQQSQQLVQETIEQAVQEAERKRKLFLNKAADKNQACEQYINESWNIYLNAFNTKGMIDALNDLYDATSQCKEPIVAYPEKYPAFLTLPQTPQGFESYFSPQETTLEELVEFIDPFVKRHGFTGSVIYSNEKVEPSYAAQVLAQSLNFVNAPGQTVEYNFDTCLMLRRIQLRLLHQLGGFVLPGQQQADGTVTETLVLSAANEWSASVNIEEEKSFRGWARLALMRIHKLYGLMKANDPLGSRYLASQKYKFKKEKEQAGTSDAVTATFDTLLTLEENESVIKMVGRWEPQKDRKKFTHDNNDTVASILYLLKEFILVDPQGEQGKKLFADLVTMATDTNFALFTQIAALQTLAEIKRECKGNCPFNETLQNRLSCRAAEMYEPLVAKNYDSYGLDSSQMRELANTLKDIYLALGGPQRFAEPDYKPYEPDYEDVYDILESIPSGKLANGRAFWARKCNGQETIMQLSGHNNYLKDGADFTKGTIQFIAEMYLFEGAVRLLGPVVRTMWGAAVARPLRTLRGLAISTPKAAEALRAGEGVSGAARELGQGIRLSNIGGQLQAGQRSGIVLQATEIAADGTQKMSIISNYRQLVGLRNKTNLADLSLFRNGVQEFSLTADGLRGLSSVEKLDTWSFLTKNMAPQIGSPLSLEALQGSSFLRFNPALRTARQGFLRSQSLRQMAMDGQFELWIGTPAKSADGALVKYGQRNWFNVASGSADDFARAFDSKNMQMVLTPRWQGNRALMPRKFGMGSASDVPMKGYIPLRGSEQVSLLQDLIYQPRLFGVTDAAVSEKFAQAGMRMSAQMPSKSYQFGQWAGYASDFLERTGQTGIPFNYLLRTASPFYGMMDRMGVAAAWWTGFLAADMVAYQAGLPQWVTHTQERDLNNFMATLPELSAGQKANSEAETGLNVSTLNNSILSHADPQWRGALLGAPITMSRYGINNLFGGENIFLPQSLRQTLQYQENALRLNNAMNFAGMYSGLKQDMQDVSAYIPASETEEIVAHYSAEMERIKQSNATWAEKAQEAQQLLLSWKTDITEQQTAYIAQQEKARNEQLKQIYAQMQQNVDVIINNGVVVEVYSAEQAEQYRAQVSSIDKSDAPVEEKANRLYEVLANVYYEVYYTLYGEYLVDNVVAELTGAQGQYFIRSDFDNLIAPYQQQIRSLTRQLADVAQLEAARTQFLQDMSEQFFRLMADETSIEERRKRSEILSDEGDSHY